MIEIIRTTAENKDFINLISFLDAELKISDGDNYSFYNQFNKLDASKNVVVAYENNIPAGCGAFKAHIKSTVEIKRMYVSPIGRRKGVTSKIVNELEKWAACCVIFPILRDL